MPLIRKKAQNTGNLFWQRNNNLTWKQWQSSVSEENKKKQTLTMSGAKSVSTVMLSMSVSTPVLSFRSTGQSRPRIPDIISWGRLGRLFSLSNTPDTVRANICTHSLCLNSLCMVYAVQCRHYFMSIWYAVCTNLFSQWGFLPQGRSAATEPH